MHLLLAPVRFIVAVIAMSSLPGSIVLLGYLYERMRRHGIAVWSGGSFQAPGWLVAAEIGGSGRRFSHLYGALLQHLRTGLMAAVSLTALVLPMGLAMAVSWYAGWNNSFNKGYEFAPVGPLVGLSGVAIGMLTLSYLPIAQARQALTGDWRVLFDWRVNSGLIGAAPFRILTLPLLFALVAVAVTGARGLLVFAPQVPAFTGIAEDPQGFLNGWFFCWGVPIVAGLMLLKRLAARGYARAVLNAVGSGRITLQALHPQEYRLLALHQPALISDPDVSADAADVGKGSANGPMARLHLRLLMILPLWFPTFALLYVQQFLNNTGTWGWLNHPLVWVPLLSYSP